VFVSGEHSTADLFIRVSIDANWITGEHSTVDLVTEILISADITTGEHSSADLVNEILLSIDSITGEHSVADLVTEILLSIDSITGEHSVADLVTEILISADFITGEHSTADLFIRVSIDANWITGEHSTADLVTEILISADVTTGEYILPFSLTSDTNFNFVCSYSPPVGNVDFSFPEVPCVVHRFEFNFFDGQNAFVDISTYQLGMVVDGYSGEYATADLEIEIFGMVVDGYSGENLTIGLRSEVSLGFNFIVGETFTTSLYMKSHGGSDLEVIDIIDSRKSITITVKINGQIFSKTFKDIETINLINICVKCDILKVEQRQINLSINKIICNPVNYIECYLKM
jgi:hypothetical protein